MGFNPFKKLARGVSKVVRKNKKGVGRLLKAGVKVAAAQVVPIVQAKVAGAALGGLSRLAKAPARHKVKKEKQAKLSRVLEMEIARPGLVMTGTRETSPASALPGGAKVKGSRPPRSSARAMPGGAPISAGAAAVRSKTSNPLGVADRVKGFVSATKKAAKSDAAKKRKELAALKKAEAAATKKAKAAEKRAIAQERARQRAADKAAKKKTTLVGSAIAGALGSKTVRGATKAGISASVKRKVQSAARSAVKKSPGLSKAVPVVAGTAVILQAGGKALQANAERQVAKAEKRLGRKLTPAERKSVTTPVNTFSGK